MPEAISSSGKPGLAPSWKQAMTLTCHFLICWVCSSHIHAWNQEGSVSDASMSSIDPGAGKSETRTWLRSWVMGNDRTLLLQNIICRGRDYTEQYFAKAEYPKMNLLRMFCPGCSLIYTSERKLQMFAPAKNRRQLQFAWEWMPSLGSCLSAFGSGSKSRTACSLHKQRSGEWVKFISRNTTRQIIPVRLR